MNNSLIILYSLSSCSFCNTIRSLLDTFNIEFNCLEVDTLPEKQRQDALVKLKSINPKASFPTLQIKDKVLVGFDIQEIKEALGLRTEIDELYDKLHTINGNIGLQFNHDKTRVFELLKGLLMNKDRYGYMSCPCRLANGKHEADKDIICPCNYRNADIEDFDSCYCNLFVTKRWNNELKKEGKVPERRVGKF